jgi:hypothetical protein
MNPFAPIALGAAALSADEFAAKERVEMPQGELSNFGTA